MTFIHSGLIVGNMLSLVSTLTPKTLQPATYLMDGVYHAARGLPVPQPVCEHSGCYWMLLK